MLPHASRAPNVSITLTLPFSMLEEIGRVAERTGVEYRKAVQAIITEGLKVYESRTGIAPRA